MTAPFVGWMPVDNHGIHAPEGHDVEVGIVYSPDGKYEWGLCLRLYYVFAPKRAYLRSFWGADVHALEEMMWAYLYALAS